MSSPIKQKYRLIKIPGPPVTEKLKKCRNKKAVPIYAAQCAVFSSIPLKDGTHREGKYLGEIKLMSTDLSHQTVKKRFEDVGYKVERVYVDVNGWNVICSKVPKKIKDITQKGLSLG